MPLPALVTIGLFAIQIMVQLSVPLYLGPNLIERQIRRRHNGVERPSLIGLRSAQEWNIDQKQKTVEGKQRADHAENDTGQ